MAHILLIDDDTELTSLLKEVLSYEGFEVSEANDGLSGLEVLDDSIDLILLDVMMPKLNGMETLKRLREHWQTPVLMLTAKGEEIDRVIGLELGADDYLPKPFSDRELLARIRAILRRTQTSLTNKSSDVIECQDLQLYPGKQEAYCQGQLLDLTSTEFALLAHFVQHPGETVTKEALSLDVLGKRLAAFDRAIDMHVSNLRKKLPERADNKPRIKTLRGRGYLMVQED
ncbi:response regulator [Vibrio cincinnatiensis]|jgi:two-component system response regulator CpxR|uniref:Transcriptional regulatory protein CpxR n=1 Tax=Vibrio cincinnatiensis DSM 19608 TaxID=1123491 RepID=A0A1T4RR17_VIBCI|nr:response regulator [Vibrio cincinnatiensis]MCG3722623.1 response regulator [Vibrio cincinnatiensis]MCG3725789.1 response regulator [Vibrio cincinnatiensis]MCG3732721.1 response regulator [Vibrio cincinnatiensis]MCG3736465.1 response regulator [Vibrio cincinnatiensis]MCG3740056.1 response regulator [Vibrio cincinnatiensis]